MAVKAEPALTIKRFGYSSNPWRIAIGGEEFWPGGKPYLSWPRKRDGVPFLEKLREIGDWSQWDRFTPEQQAQVWALVKQTETYTRYQAIEARFRASLRNPFL